MSSNLELKARINNISDARKIAEALPAIFEGELIQTDTYYAVPQGRLKLREFADGSPSELIFYDRDESTNQRLSNFITYSTTDPNALSCLLEQAFGILTKVSKHRLLYLFQQTRIHLDEVKSLGTFLEFEVPLLSSLADARLKLQFLIGQFQIDEKNCFRKSYLDLMLEETAFNKI